MSWPGSHPFERLRYVARADGASPALIAADAAESLAVLAERPETLVTSARRLLEFHPTNGPLWWVCAKVLAAADPAAAARLVVAELEEDLTPLELAAAIETLGEAPVLAVISAGDVLCGAVASALAVSVRAIGEEWQLRRLAGALGQVVDAVTMYSVFELADALAGCHVLLLEALAASSRGALVGVGPQGDVLSHELLESLLTAAAVAEVPVWLTTGIGRVLPDQLFAALVASVGGSKGVPAIVAPDVLATVIGPGGQLEVDTALAASGCGVPPELLKRAR